MHHSNTNKYWNHVNHTKKIDYGFQTTDFWSRQTSILTLPIAVTNSVTSLSESAVSLCVKLNQSLYLGEIKGTFSRTLALIEALNGGYRTQRQCYKHLHFTTREFKFLCFTF